jgi:hypothetical protein
MSLDDEKAQRRRRLVGRMIIVIFGLLLMAYVVADVTYRMQMNRAAATPASKP